MHRKVKSFKKSQLQGVHLQDQRQRTAHKWNRYRFKQRTAYRVLELCGLRTMQALISVIDSAAGRYAKTHQTSCLQTRKELKVRTNALCWKNEFEPNDETHCNDSPILRASTVHTNVKAKIVSRIRNENRVRVNSSTYNAQQTGLLHTVLWTRESKSRVNTKTNILYKQCKARLRRGTITSLMRPSRKHTHTGI